MIQNRTELASYCFIKLDIFFLNSPANTETQEKIEKLLLDQFSD